MSYALVNLHLAAQAVLQREAKGVFYALGEVDRGERPLRVEEALFDIFEDAGDLWEVDADVRALGLCLAASMLRHKPSQGVKS
jgi:hypothetical protein